MTAKIFKCQMQMYKFSFEKQTEKGKILFLAIKMLKNIIIENFFAK